MSDGRLTTMEPDPVWDEDSYEETVEATEGLDENVVYKVWGGDWCKDCRSQLPDFGAALEAAAVPEESVEHFAVDEDKQGPGVEEYDVEYIPTVVVETDGTEIARFVEDEPVPIAVYLADELRVALGDPA